ncbi:hypothetical protein C2R22_02410 [Salinigranum rubrum]|uniref:Uncharacterized protein n=1 Tax=Salinigranum rubrum TaxID=755307 RepID=A0A2I8VFE1_9EURY|nr:hypothetical protein C2R22_02410 [Salinigranum rubrum]
MNSVPLVTPVDLISTSPENVTVFVEKCGTSNDSNPPVFSTSDVHSLPSSCVPYTRWGAYPSARFIDFASSATVRPPAFTSSRITIARSPDPTTDPFSRYSSARSGVVTITSVVSACDDVITDPWRSDARSCGSDPIAKSSDTFESGTVTSPAGIAPAGATGNTTALASTSSAAITLA